MKKLYPAFVTAGVLLLGALGLRALQIDPVSELGRLRWLASGATVMVEQTNSANQVEMRNAADDTVAMVWDDGTSATALVPKTGAQLALLTPPASGYAVINITRATLCISSGSGQGAWVAMSTGSTNDVIQFNSCYK